MRTLLATSLALGLLIVAARPLRAADPLTPGATPAGKQPVYTTTGRLQERHIESVLMNPRHALSVGGGSGWLLHSGKGQRDACDNPDATSGLRMMCVGW
ncbi:MAG TPA: hypothetical protein VMW56_08595 [Candidatus Margulisiibacteriota bacterium]|nr:hypothetical protein [Candidatus Margulisiibacteriota bacterium]